MSTSNKAVEQLTKDMNTYLNAVNATPEAIRNLALSHKAQQDTFVDRTEDIFNLLTGFKDTMFSIYDGLRNHWQVFVVGAVAVFVLLRR